MTSRRILVALLLLAGATACQPGVQSASCPTGWTYAAFESWWQKGVNGETVPPQQLPASGVGGHLHVEGCVPIGLRIDGPTLQLHLNVMTHQRFTGKGDRLDVGLAPGGSTLVAVPMNWDSRCPDGMCHASVDITVPLSNVGDGKQILRLRYLSTKHPNSERQFASNEVPFSHNQNPSGCYETEGKGWFTGVDYARAGIKTCLPGEVSGTYTFTQTARSTKLPISVIETHIDARYGADDFSGLIDRYTPPTSTRSLKRSVSIDTTKFTNGDHCLSVLTQVPLGDGVNTGVLEVPIRINNPGAPEGTGAGACFPIP